MDRKYCIECGCENSSEEKICRKCGASLDQEEHLFKEYLLKKTKASLKGKVTDSLFSIIKNWIMSHLYGTVLMVSVISILLFNNSSSQPAPHIRTVASPERPYVYYATETVPEETVVSGEKETEQQFTEEDIAAARRELFHYSNGVIFQTVGYDEAWEFEEEFQLNPEEYLLPDIYGYQGEHAYRFVDPNLETFWDEAYSEADPSDEVKSEIGRQLMEDGYRAMEFEFTDFYEDHTEGNGSWTQSYLFVMAEFDDVWYVAAEYER